MYKFVPKIGAGLPANVHLACVGKPVLAQMFPTDCVLTLQAPGLTLATVQVESGGSLKTLYPDETSHIHTVKPLLEPRPGSDVEVATCHSKTSPIAIVMPTGPTFSLYVVPFTAR